MWFHWMPVPIMVVPYFVIVKIRYFLLCRHRLNCNNMRVCIQCIPTFACAPQVARTCRRARRVLQCGIITLLLFLILEINRQEY